MEIEKYSSGIGDRFGPQGNAQLATVRKTLDKGADLANVSDFGAKIFPEMVDFIATIFKNN